MPHAAMTILWQISGIVSCRALFGREEECITSLAAWQHMCTEARWIGRALFDAEDIVLQHTEQPASAP